MGRLIDADEYEKRIKPYDTEDVMDKALYNFAHETLMMTSTAQPEREKGEWIFDGIDECGGVAYMRCSKCGHRVYWCITSRPNYCSKCGADMRGDEKCE